MRVGLLVAGVVLAAVIGLLVTSHDATRLPVYQGKTAREWLYLVRSSNPDRAIEAFAAFHQMGSNGVAYLVDEFEREDSSWDKFCHWAYWKLPAGIRTHLRQPFLQAERCPTIFLVLQDVQSGTEIPPLLQYLAKGDDDQQALALRVLADFVGPTITNCLVAVTNCLGSKNYWVCVGATDVLEKMGLANLAISPLVNFVSSTNAEVRVDCLETLAHIDRANTAKWTKMLTNEPTWFPQPSLSGSDQPAANAAANQPPK